MGFVSLNFVGNKASKFLDELIRWVMPSIRNALRAMVGLSLLTILMACSGPQTGTGIFDPLERQNRDVHEFNRQVDKAFLRPASNVYGGIIPAPVRIGVGNFADNLSIPGAILNDLLQLNIEDAVHNTFRLLVNTTVGLGGVLDPAMAIGIEPRDSDFGETLHVWGFREGAYVELPFVGPSTTRDSVGMAVDLMIDPLNTLFPAPEKYIAPAVAAAAKVGDRYRYGTTIDSVLHESADSYAQSRLFYLESRRFELGEEENSEDELYDLYEEAYE